MKRKENNNLIKVIQPNNIGYFTSLNRVAKFLDVQVLTITWAITHGNTIKKCDAKVEIVDGSEIPYKYINN